MHTEQPSSNPDQPDIMWRIIAKDDPQPTRCNVLMAIDTPGGIRTRDLRHLLARLSDQTGIPGCRSPFNHERTADAPRMHQQRTPANRPEDSRILPRRTRRKTRRPCRFKFPYRCECISVLSVDVVPIQYR